MSSLNLLFRSLLNLIYPLRCQACRALLPVETELPLCRECREQIRFNEPPFCPRCGKPVPGLIQTPPRPCPGCSGEDYYFQRSYSACQYEGVLRKCIHLFKYRKKLILARPLAELLLVFAEKHLAFSGEEIVVPVPLHPSRLREREFNQSHLLAVALTKKFALKLLNNNLIRHRNTAAQTELTRKERLKNIEEAFRVKRPRVFQDKSIILIDDVFTTGATVSECSRVLREAGASNVTVLTLARGN